MDPRSHPRLGGGMNLPGIQTRGFARAACVGDGRGREGGAVEIG